MKSFIITLCLTILTLGWVQAQNGLESIVVETFYISDAADAAFAGGSGMDAIPLGSTTYRVYVDMPADHQLVSIYGQTDVAAGKIDALKIESTMPFFNNEDRGDLFGYSIAQNRLDEGTVMVDSYFSTGRTSATTAGVLKDEDTNGPIANGDGVLQATNPLAGTPINVKDGNIPSTSTIAFTPTPGFDALLNVSFGSDNQAGNGINTSNAALGLPTAVSGPTAVNRVLIGQFTTHGVFTFSLNLQIRNTLTNVVEEWVAETPQAGQYTHPSLTFAPAAPNVAPTVSITAPAAGASYAAGATVNVTATAADTDGTIAQVAFFFNGTPVSVDTDGSNGYTASFTATVNGNITAVATDDDNATTTSAPVNIVVVANVAPTVSITAPAAGASYANGATVNVTATAADTDGTIAQVAFFFNSTSVGVDTDGSNGYTASFAATGSGNITAVARDDDNATTTSAPVNIVVAGNSAPTVSITAPLTATTTSSVAISATATDSDGTVTKVDFFVDNVLLSTDTDGSNGYTATWTAVAGSHVLKATATDNLLATGSASQNITVTSNQAPVVALTSHTNNQFVAQGPVTLQASATDNGTITQVQFFVDGVSVGVDTDGSNGYSAIWNAVYVSATTVNVVTVVATDNLGLTGNSVPVNLKVSNPAGAPYQVESVTQFCNDETVCMPIATAVGATVDDIIGFDIVVNFDNDVIYPTGQIFNSSDLAAAALFETDYSIDFTAEEMLISVFFKSTAPIGTVFTGMGDIICVEFAKRPAFDPSDATTIEVASIQESYTNGVVVYDTGIQSGDFISVPDAEFPSVLVFWVDNSPIGYTPGTNLITNIRGTNGTCAAVSTTAVQPNATGEFVHNLNNGLSIQIDKDIASTTDVLPVINGFDVLQVRKLLIDQLSSPSVYQILAMDVNIDGVVSAGDVSQMNQRIVLLLNEFRQAWNYDAAGNQLPTYGPSKDWVWVEQTRLNTNPGFVVSATFPDNDGTGYSKAKVPSLPFCLPTPVTDFTECPEIDTETYKGILLGDINGNWAGITPDGTLRSVDIIVVNLDETVQLNDSIIEFPVYFESTDAVNTVDIKLKFTRDEFAFHAVTTSNNELQVLGHYNENDSTLRITSNSIGTLDPSSPVYFIQFKLVTENQPVPNDFLTTGGFINGNPATVDIIEQVTAVNEIDVFNLKVYPNPASNLLNVVIAENADLEIVDMYGRVVLLMNTIKANEISQVDLTNLAGGVYVLNVFNDKNVSSQRFVISK